MLLEIPFNKLTGDGAFLRGEYGIGNMSGFGAIVTPGTLELLRNIGVVNDQKRLPIQRWEVLHFNSLNIETRGVIEAIMNGSPKFIVSNHVVWENTKNFFIKPEVGVHPSGQVVWMMLSTLGLVEIQSPWVETATPINTPGALID